MGVNTSVVEFGIRQVEDLWPAGDRGCLNRAAAGELYGREVQQPATPHRATGGAHTTSDLVRDPQQSSRVIDPCGTERNRLTLPGVIRGRCASCWGLMTSAAIGVIHMPEQDRAALRDAVLVR